MSDEKDFLSQFSEKKNTVPESFKQEERKPVTKQRKPVNKTLIIVLCVLLLVVGIAVYFIFFAPKIEMPNFVGENKTDVAAWVKQQGIETSGIIFEEDYYFDYDEGTIISQSVEAGKKVKENVKITFTASLGADPDELIKVPDLMTMTKTEIQDWISENKLSKTKITSAYSDSVESGNVISFAYSGCDEDTFTRSSTLKISVSKGEAPAGTIAVEDFTKKTYDYVSSWATSKKVNLTKTEQFSDTVDKGYVISQSIESGKTMKEEETINVVVSKGKGITLPDFTKMTKEQVEDWMTTNKGYSVTVSKEKYSYDSTAYIMAQSVKAGQKVGTDDAVILTKNLGNGFYMDSSLLATGASADKVVDWAKSMKDSGLDVSVNTNDVDSDLPKGQIVSYKIKDGDTKYTIYEKLPLDVVITLNVSNGKTAAKQQVTVGDYFGKTKQEAETAISTLGLTSELSYKYCDKTKDSVVEQSIASGEKVDIGSTITLTVSNGNTFKLSDLTRSSDIIGHSYEEVVELRDKLVEENDGLNITIRLSSSTPDTENNPVASIYIQDDSSSDAFNTECSINSVFVVTLTR